MGRKKLNPNEKKKLVRYFLKSETIDLIGLDKLKSEFDKVANQLQTTALQNSANEALKSR